MRYKTKVMNNLDKPNTEKNAALPAISSAETPTKKVNNFNTILQC